MQQLNRVRRLLHAISSGLARGIVFCCFAPREAEPLTDDVSVLGQPRLRLPEEHLPLGQLVDQVLFHGRARPVMRSVRRCGRPERAKLKTNP